MSKLSKAEVENIAQLARLKLTPEETALFQEQLSAILDYAEAVRQLDTTDIPPTTSAIPLVNVMRPDEQHTGLSTAEALANAPDTTDNSFRVKPILP